ncbi:MAG: histidinol-phosphatase [Selenomonadaceae bacterium]|nr:histidinol-phosphatase [Selenomonadaceae bacterium]
MKIDYHMHFEYGDYNINWVQGFFNTASLHNINEIGITEHSHTFPTFKNLYYNDLILDDSPVGKFQQAWLKKNKFKHSLDDYFNFMAQLKLNHNVKTGIEVCNFQNQAAVKQILNNYNFDYIIGSVHFINGWAYDSSEIKDEWNNHNLQDIYECYTQQVEMLAAAHLYDVLGHPFNVRLFNHIPDFDTTPYLVRTAQALKSANMAVDVNTGTLYRYPVKEISPYPDFMKIAADYELPIIISSDAHRPEDCGRFCDEAIDYVKQFGYNQVLTFNNRQRTLVDLN